MSYSVSFNNMPDLTANLIIHSRGARGVVYASLFGYEGVMNSNLAAAKNKTGINIKRYRTYNFNGKDYNFYTSKIPDSDYVHTVIMKKDLEFVEDNVPWIALHFIENSEDYNEETGKFTEKVYDRIFDKLNQYCQVPIIRPWVPHIVDSLVTLGYVHTNNVYSTDVTSENHHVISFSIVTPVNVIANIISAGLRDNKITINGNSTVPREMANITGIDSYLSTYSDILTDKIQKAFVPRFTPGEDKYDKVLDNFCDYTAYNAHMKLFPAQKSVIQAVSNALDEQKSAFIIGEMSSGKTILSMGVVQTNAKGRTGLTAVTMCPPHMVMKWERHLKEQSPRTDVYVIRTVDDLMKLEPVINDKSRTRTVWLVMSQNSVKNKYRVRPAAVWQNKQYEYDKEGNLKRIWEAGYHCPDCGARLTHKERTGRGRYQNVRTVMNNEFTFGNKPTSENSFCPECHASLWTAHNKDIEYGKGNGANRWIRIVGRTSEKSGWMEERHIYRIKDELQTKIGGGNASDDEKRWFKSINRTVQSLNDGTYTDVAPKKISIAEYVKKNLKGKIDYLICDEIHELKGENSEQGLAMGEIASASRKIIGLTGTLMNGYALGVYYLLFRLFSKKMVEEGYSYEDGVKFATEFGVLKQDKVFSINGDSRSDGKAKQASFLPGISPLVFTKFLLENACFISLEDITDEMPGYREIPVPCDMDNELAAAYLELERSFRNNKNVYQGAMRYMAQFINLLMNYPDQPFDHLDIYDPGTKKLICSPQSIDRERVRNKETEMLNIVRDKVANGEKVLIYYESVNKTNLGNRLISLLETEGIKASELKSNGGPKAEDREKWIADKIEDGMQVMICNPALVKTGLDLLDFTCIIFYQTGYNLYTMRQASRRSWRLNQMHDVEVYFLYYRGTVQEKIIGIMATKLQAALAIEGKFNEEGLSALSNNQDILTQIATTVTDELKNNDEISVSAFEHTAKENKLLAESRAITTLADTREEVMPTLLRDKFLNSKKRNKRFSCLDKGTAEFLQTVMFAS